MQICYVYIAVNQLLSLIKFLLDHYCYYEESCAAILDFEDPPS